MAERRRRHSSSPEAEAEAEAAEVTLKLGIEDVRKLKETVDNFNTVLGSIEDETPGPSHLARSGRKGGKCGL